MLLYGTHAARHMVDDTAEGRARREQQDGIIRMSGHLFMPDDGITFNKFPAPMKRAIITHMAAGPCRWPPRLTLRRFETLITNYRRMKPFMKVIKRKNVKDFGNMDGDRPPPRDRADYSRSRTPQRHGQKKRRRPQYSGDSPVVVSDDDDDDIDDGTERKHDREATTAGQYSDDNDRTEHKARKPDRSAEPRTQEARHAAGGRRPKAGTKLRTVEHKAGGARAAADKDDDSSPYDMSDSEKDKDEVHTAAHTSALEHVYCLIIFVRS